MYDVYWMTSWVTDATYMGARRLGWAYSWRYFKAGEVTPGKRIPVRMFTEECKATRKSAVLTFCWVSGVSLFQCNTHEMAISVCPRVCSEAPSHALKTGQPGELLSLELENDDVIWRL